MPRWFGWTLVAGALMGGTGAVALALAAVAGGAPSASNMVSIHNARVGLVGGAFPGNGQQYLAALRIELAPGWKTYWRMPGDAGVPPTFDWSGSGNVRNIKVRYPAPIRLSEPAAETIGYKGSVWLPVEITPQDASARVDLKLAIEFGVCRDICIPAQADLRLPLEPSQLGGKAVEQIAAALDRVPRPAAARRGSDPELKRVTAKLDGADAHLIVEARFAGDGEGADVFIEAPESIYVPVPKRLADAADGAARFIVDLSRGGVAKELQGKVLTFTLVSSAGASEAQWIVP